MSERFVRYFWETIQFTTEKFESDAETCEYVYFYDLKDSPKAKDVIFPFLLSSENENARRPIDVIKIYFPHLGEIDDVVTIVNHGIFSLYGFKYGSMSSKAADPQLSQHLTPTGNPREFYIEGVGEKKTLILSAPLFAIPPITTFTHGIVQQDPKYRRPYRDIEMQQIYDYFTVVLTFPEGALVLTSPVTMTIITEGITKYHELVFKAVVIE